MVEKCLLDREQTFEASQVQPQHFRLNYSFSLKSGFVAFAERESLWPQVAVVGFCKCFIDFL